MPTLGPPGVRLSYDQLKQLWISNGGNPASAPIMAGIAIAESGGLSNNLNPTAPDYSVGLWQVNYYGSLLPSRTASYGSPEALAADVNRQAKAAISISGNGKNLSPWTTYTSGAAGRAMAAREQGLGGLPATPALPNLGSAAAPSGAASADNEGLLFKFHITGTSFDAQMARSTARKMIGSAVMGVGGVVGLAGVFVLVGSKTSLPGPVGVVQGAMKGRTDRRAGRAAASVAEQTPDELAERRRRRSTEQRGRAAEGSYESARAEGEAAAGAAGPF